MTIKITNKTNPEVIMEKFRKALESGDTINLETNRGFIYLAGGILSKLQDDKQYFAIEGEWRQV